MTGAAAMSWIAGGGCLAEADRLVSHGLGVFETMLAVDGRVARADWHAERMAAGCANLGIDPPAWPEMMEELASRLPREGWWRVRVTRSGGCGPLNRLHGDSAVTIVTLAAAGPPPESMTVVTAPWRRNEGSPLSRVKSTSYAESLLALDHARRAGTDDVVFLNAAGRLAEAATANLFLRIDGVHVTPPCDEGCLPGIARRWMLETFPARTKVEPVDPTMIAAADAVLLCSAVRGPVPVLRWDQRELSAPDDIDELRATWRASLFP